MSSVNSCPALMGCIVNRENLPLVYVCLIFRLQHVLQNWLRHVPTGLSSKSRVQSVSVSWPMCNQLFSRWKVSETTIADFLVLKSRGVVDLEALFSGLRSLLVHHACLIETAGCFRCPDLDRDLDVYLPAMFAALHDRTASFRSAKPSIVKTPSATLCQDASSIITHLHARLAA